MKPVIRIIGVACFLCLFNNSKAQNGHYWTQQYGTRSMLLSGSVIGGVNDLGAVYYNPARIAQINNSAFLVNAHVYEYNTYEVQDAFGNNKDASKAKFGGVPSMAAGTFKIGFLPKHYFAWAIITRQNFDFNISYRNEVYDDIFSSLPGDEYFGSAIAIESANSEIWSGFSWAYHISKKLSVGASGYYATLSNSKSASINLQAYTDSKNTMLYRFDKGYDLKHSGLLFKLGLSYLANHYLIGLTVTTPSLKLTGSGNYRSEEFLSGAEDQISREDIYKTTYQSGLNSTYHTPLAVGTGITWFIGKSKLHMSVEYYNALPKYTIIEASDYVGQSDGDMALFSLVDTYKSVINGGIGAEIYLSEKISFYSSFCTDFSAVSSDLANYVNNKSEVNRSTFNDDYYHFGSGFVLNMKGADITLGVTYTGGQSHFLRPVSFPDEEGDEIYEPDEKVDVMWQRMRVVVGLSLPLFKEKLKNIEKKIGL